MVDIFSMKVMKIMNKFGIIGIAFWVTQMWLLAIPEFHLPAGTPGLRDTTQQIDTQHTRVDCERVVIENPITHATYVLFFPTNGYQPSTSNAGEWSGARYNDDCITDWWVRVFGGNRAVNLSRLGAPDTLLERQMGFDTGGVATHIIQVNTTIAGTPADFERQFWRTFRNIAADSVGRVLLYRLLIEIRRTNGPNGPGCCGADVIPSHILRIRTRDLNARNTCRCIAIHSAAKCAFSPKNYAIKFIHNDAKTTRTLTVEAGGLATQRTPMSSDICLFHEMLHWFHKLRNPGKQKDNKNKNTRRFSYATRCYYGDPAFAVANYPGAFVWRMSRKEADKINGEEIATILGSPNLNIDPHTYVLGGMDLINPNAFYLTYRADTSRITIGGVQQYIPNRCKIYQKMFIVLLRASLCVGDILLGLPCRPYIINPPIRFRLAHKIASDCYQAITGNPHPNWGFVQGEAIN